MAQYIEVNALLTTSAFATDTCLATLKGRAAEVRVVSTFPR